MVHVFNQSMIVDDGAMDSNFLESERMNPISNNYPKKTGNKIKLYNDDIFYSPHEEDWEMPKWIEDYIKFHRETRKKYPGKELFTTNDTNAPKILVRICPGVCGGLNDRLSSLPTDLHVANMTNRILFIHWCKPVPIQELLIPNLIDFVVPDGLGYEVQKNVLALPKFPVCWKIENDCKEMDNAIHEAIYGRASNERVLTFMWVQHINETTTERRLRALGEKDMIHNTPTFGHIFWSIFQLNPNIKDEIQIIKDKFNLQPKSFSILHCRIRHPRGLSSGNKILHQSKSEGQTIDQGGFNFTGDAKNFALDVITHAMQCSRLITNDNEPLYFISDSEDLVNYVVRDLPKRFSSNAVFKARSKVNLISRDLSLPNLHIDRQKRHPPRYYYPTIIDLVLAANARCIIHGLGKYTSLASKISFNHCSMQHRTGVWGFDAEKHDNFCSKESYSHLT